MKKTLVLCLALLFIGYAATVAKAQTENDIFGYYTIQGKAPVGFTDISEIHLAGDYGAQQKPPVHGLIRLKNKTAKDFAINKPTLNGKNITFTTKAVGGISYQFTGTFVKFPNNEAQEGTVLRGILRKFKGKTKIAEANLKFSYSAGG
ncbi:MAG TPA: hypothetical protein VF721_04300 [Pyrinomonadaceae bacterium]|jgi:hypothetical protein